MKRMKEQPSPLSSLPPLPRADRGKVMLKLDLKPNNFPGQQVVLKPCHDRLENCLSYTYFSLLYTHLSFKYMTLTRNTATWLQPRLMYCTFLQNNEWWCTVHFCRKMNVEYWRWIHERKVFVEVSWDFSDLRCPYKCLHYTPVCPNYVQEFGLCSVPFCRILNVDDECSSQLEIFFLFCFCTLSEEMRI